MAVSKVTQQQQECYKGVSKTAWMPTTAECQQQYGHQTARMTQTPRKLETRDKSLVAEEHQQL